MDPVFKFRSVVTVDFDKIPVILGRVTAAEVVTIEEKERNTITVDTPNGLYRVFETYDLAEAFACAKVGDGILIRFLQTKALKKAGRKLRQFNVQVFEWPKDGVVPIILQSYAQEVNRVESYHPPPFPPVSGAQ
jgi:hypothetical protein